jgi:hypothetical protein
MQITEDEFQLLFSAFSIEGYPERFDYRRLCRALDAIQLDRAAAALEVDAEHIKDKSDRQVYSSLHTIREKLNGKRMTPWPYFKTCKDDKISESEFRERVSEFNIHILESDMQGILDRYGDADGISWRDFCADIERNVFV